MMMMMISWNIHMECDCCCAKRMSDYCCWSASRRIRRIRHIRHTLNVKMNAKMNVKMIVKMRASLLRILNVNDFHHVACEFKVCLGPSGC